MALENPITGGAWNDLSLSSNYAATGLGFLTPAYRKDSLGIVHLRGTATYVSGGVTVICTLPIGFWPVGITRFLIPSVDENGLVSTAWVDLISNGDLVFVGGSARALTFDQISFATY